MPSLASQPLCHHCSQCQNLPSSHYISGGDEDGDGEDDEDVEDGGGDEDNVVLMRRSRMTFVTL